MPQGENTLTSKSPPKAPVGIALNYKNGGLGGEWTVQSQDGWIVTIGQVAGDGMVTRTIDLRDPREAARLEAVRSDPANRTALRSAGRKPILAYDQQIAFSDARGQLAVKGFDARERRYLISGIVNGQEVNHWVTEGVARDLKGGISGESFLKTTRAREPKNKKAEGQQTVNQQTTVGAVPRQERTLEPTNTSTSQTAAKSVPVASPISSPASSAAESTEDTPRQARQELIDRKTTLESEGRARDSVLTDNPTRRETGDAASSFLASNTQVPSIASGMSFQQSAAQPLRIAQTQGTALPKGVQTTQGFSAANAVRQAENRLQQLRQRGNELDQQRAAIETQRQTLTQKNNPQFVDQSRAISRQQQDLQLARMDNQREMDQVQHVLGNPTPEVLQAWVATQPVAMPIAMNDNAAGRDELAEMIEPPRVAEAAIIPIQQAKRIATGAGGSRRYALKPTFEPKASWMKRMARPFAMAVALTGAQQSDRIAHAQNGMSDARQEMIGERGLTRRNAPVIPSAAQDLTASYASKTEDEDQQRFRRRQTLMGDTKNLLIPEGAEVNKEEMGQEFDNLPEFQNEFDRAGQLAREQQLDEGALEANIQEDGGSFMESSPNAQNNPLEVPAQLKPKIPRTGMRALDIGQGGTSIAVIPLLTLFIERHVRLPFIHRKLPEFVRKIFPVSTPFGVVLTICLDFVVFFLWILSIVYLAAILVPIFGIGKALGGG